MPTMNCYGNDSSGEEKNKAEDESNVVEFEEETITWNLGIETRRDVESVLVFLIMPVPFFVGISVCVCLFVWGFI